MELDEDSEIFIGPPPPAVVAEAESANEAERFEEVPNSALYAPLIKFKRSLCLCCFVLIIMCLSKKVYIPKYVELIVVDEKSLFVLFLVD